MHEVMLMIAEGRVLVMDADAQLRDAAPPPVTLSPSAIRVTPDLVTGDFLVLADPGVMYVYDPVDDVWTERTPGPVFAASRGGVVVDLVPAAVPRYCVSMVPVYNFNASTVFVYRHGLEP
jgi:hypothetical protein